MCENLVNIPETSGIGIPQSSLIIPNRRRVKTNGCYHDETIENTRCRQQGEFSQKHDHTKLKNVVGKYPGFKKLLKAVGKISSKAGDELTLGDVEGFFGQDLGIANAHKKVQSMKPNSQEIKNLAERVTQKILERKPELTTIAVV